VCRCYTRHTAQRENFNPASQLQFISEARLREQVAEPLLECCMPQRVSDKLTPAPAGKRLWLPHRIADSAA
jgi:hypothetical protein